MQRWVAEGAARALSRTARAQEDLIADLQVSHRAKDAYWALLGLEDALLIYKGLLAHENSLVRMYACRALDHLLRPEDIGLLVPMLDDPEPSVRATVLHTLICEHCKDDYCAPETGDVLARALDLAVNDPSARVRAMAVEALGGAVHTSRTALDTLQQVADADPSPANRKKAKWYLPGGAIYKRTAGYRLAACLAVFVVPFGAGCASEGAGDTAKAVERALAVAADSPSATADIGQAVKGDWTRLVFACAYSNQEVVDKDLGFRWPEYRATDQDGENMWIFATDTEVLKWAVVRAYHGDPCYYHGKNPPTVVPRSDAVFRVEDTGERVIDGRTPYRALRPRGGD